MRWFQHACRATATRPLRSRSRADRHSSCGRERSTVPALQAALAQGGSMRKWLTFASLVLAVGACDARRDVAAPDRAQSLLGILGGGSGLLDPARSAALANALPTDNLVVIVNYDENAVTRDAVTSAILSTGAGAIQFKHLALVAALATPSQITQIAALSGIRSIYLNRQLLYYGVPFSGLLLHGRRPGCQAHRHRGGGRAVHLLGPGGLRLYPRPPAGLQHPGGQQLLGHERRLRPQRSDQQGLEDGARPRHHGRVRRGERRSRPEHLEPL